MSTSAWTEAGRWAEVSAIVIEPDFTFSDDFFFLVRIPILLSSILLPILDF